MAITYNVLNLQQSLSQSGTPVATYSWLADGTKCAVADNTTSGFDYLGSLKYTRNGSTRTLESTDFGGGRVVYSGGVYTRYYYITDHLGSVRVITDNSGAVQERNDYYPFGGRHANVNYGQLSANKQKFNGKELQTTGFLDYGARMYDDAIGRWSVVDPLGEKYKGLSPYNYCENNSISLIDPDGKSSTEAVEQDQKKNNEEPNWFQQAIATTLLSIINTAKLYGDNKTGNQTETEKLAAGFNLFTSVVFAIQGGFEMMKPSNSMSKSGNLAGYTDDAVSTEVAGVNAKTRTLYTKSNLKLGQEMHKAYKFREEGIKEFRLPSGKRIDFIDINNGAIYELKPFNPRAIKAGQKQLDVYIKELQKMPEFKNINFKKVLDTY